MRPYALLTGLGLTVATSACSPAILPATTPASAKAVAWSYEGDTGAEQWGKLDPSYAVCATGQAQTPVALANATATAGLDEVKLAYQASAPTITNNGHTEQVDLPAGSQMTLGATTYKLLQYHYHTPSEHTLDGERFPMEVHFVHQDGSGNLAVLGVFVKDGPANAAYDFLVGNLPAQKGQTATLASQNPASLLPGSLNYITYGGSLTTPPCTEGVRWLVLQTPVTLSTAQLGAFKSLFHDNSRPLQPLNGRNLQLKG